MISLSKSAPVRKGRAFAAQVFKRFAPASEAPIVLVNSFPKSGTHLLYQVIRAIPGLRDFGTFLASTPTLTLRERTTQKTLSIIDGFVSGEIVRGHLFYAPEVLEALQRRGVVHFFIYRDLRDVACSESHYLATMNRWHRLHRIFKKREPAERIMLSIRGDTAGELPVPFPDIGQRFGRFRPWLDCPSVLGVRFEDLVGERQRETVAEIIRHYETIVGRPAGIDVDAGVRAINPEGSHTFRKGGGAGSWKKRFTPQHTEAFEAVAGDLSRDLGYD